MLNGKKILLGITGSIAAYKSVHLVRLLVKAGAEVKVILTPAAKDFVTPLTLSTLSRNPVLTGLFTEDNWSNHVMLGRWADLMVIAPLSCNTLSKMATGGCDNLLMAIYLSATCPIIAAPAMDEDMWHHPSTKQNLETIRSFGNIVMQVGTGELASGLNGEGRMAEPETIFSFIADYFQKGAQLAGKKVLITAGPTYEPIDPVRFIGNHSSGKMGWALAQEMQKRGAAVTLVAGPMSIPAGTPGIEIIRVQTAEEMFQACLQRFGTADLTIMAAAVADYQPVQMAAQKIKKNDDKFLLELTRTKDILGTLGVQKKNGQVLVGFALETEKGTAFAKQKLEKKNADLIILNTLQDPGAGFGKDTNKITIFGNDGMVTAFELKSKKEVAADIADTIFSKFYA